MGRGSRPVKKTCASPGEVEACVLLGSSLGRHLRAPGSRAAATGVGGALGGGGQFLRAPVVKVGGAAGLG